jgi:hypothetical protein
MVPHDWWFLMEPDGGERSGTMTMGSGCCERLTTARGEAIPTYYFACPAGLVLQEHYQAIDSPCKS